MRTTFVISAACALLAAPSMAATPVLGPVDFSACMNTQYSVNGPVGVTAGNAQTKDSRLTFTLLDPGAGNNLWNGVSGQKIAIKLSVASPKAVYMLMNTFAGQSGVVNATVVFKGTGGAQMTARLRGDLTIRDYNNWQWTNNINNTSTQEWWTNNLNPQSQDMTHRIDAHKFNLGSAFAGQTLTEITVKSPENAAPNFMSPILFAIGIDYPGAGGTVPSRCTAR